LLSSNSGSQRVSQAALSRSRFLRLAAGALLPFVGWRPSAAAALNLEPAQNNSAPETKDAAAPRRMGAILVNQFGPVKIHSYLSPADGLQVNTQMIEGPNAVVIFDGQLLLRYADEVASYVQMLGKPIDRIILSHAHTDHWGGLQVLTERFPDARVFALEGSPTRSAPEAQPGSMASAAPTATRSRRKSPFRRRLSAKVCNGSTASPTTSSGLSTPNRICSSLLCCPSKKC
jgi:hypothetical protein